MAKIFIFSGTTEGRELSEYLCGKEMMNTVFVATEYGEIVVKESSFCEVRCGRLDFGGMKELFAEEQPDIVFDATHPFAVEVTKNIKSALSESCNSKYVRIQRDIPLTEQLLREDYEDIEVVLSTEGAIDYLKKTTGNILLTTGVKTLKQYASELVLKDRLIARILPSKESIDLAYDAGVKPGQIVAMEGPFLTGINEALIEQYNVKVLVTKNSGIKGGFIEKLEAAKNKGVKTVVIDPLKVAEGITLEEAKVIADGLDVKQTVIGEIKNITIAGIGVGNLESVTVAAINAIKSANLIVGAGRMVEFAKGFNKSAIYQEEYLADKVAEIINDSNAKNVVVLVSGDTGFFSGAIKYRATLESMGHSVRVIPAVSSISYLCSKAGADYSDAALVSLHGKTADIIKPLTENKKAFYIVSGFEDVNYIVSEVLKMFSQAKFFVGFNLGLSDEKVDSFSMDNVVTYSETGLYVVGVIINE